MKTFDYHKLADKVEKHLSQKEGRKVDIRDYANSTNEFYEWADSRGYGETDPDGKGRGSSQIWFAEFNKEVKKQRPYRDFWHAIMGDFKIMEQEGERPYYIQFNFAAHRKNKFEHLEDENHWIIKILDGFLEVLGKDAGKEITVKIDW